MSPRVPQEHLDRRREQILHAALRCAARNGFQKTTMRDICREADLSTGAVYNYFRSKEEILEALTRLGRGSKQSLLAGLRSADSARDGLRELFRAVFVAYRSETFRTYGAIDVDTYGEALRNEQVGRVFREELDCLAQPLAEIVEAWQEKRELRRDVDALHLASSLIALTVGIKIHLLIQPDLSVDEFEKTVERAFVDTLTGSPEEAPGET